MNYNKLLGTVKALHFIRDDKTADAAIKAVLGIMLSSMREEDAKRFAQVLPEPLTIERLRGHQVRPIRISPEYYITEIAMQFRLTHEQSRELVSSILHETKNSIPEEIKIDWECHLPADMAEAVRKA